MPKSTPAPDGRCRPRLGALVAGIRGAGRLWRGAAFGRRGLGISVNDRESR